MDTTFETKKRHHGYNVKRLREILGVKQEDLAERLQLSQQTVSRYENSEMLEDNILNNISKALNIPIDSIKNFSEEGVVSIFGNNYQDEAVSYAVHYKCTFNPLEKVVSLYDEKVELLERMLQTEKEKVSLLEEVLKNKK